MIMGRGRIQPRKRGCGVRARRDHAQSWEKKTFSVHSQTEAKKREPPGKGCRLLTEGEERGKSLAGQRK